MHAQRTNTALQTYPAVERSAAARPPLALWLSAAALLAGWFMLWQKLSVDWSVNDQYQYGWFVPPLALALLGLRWRDRPAPGAPPAVGGLVALATLGLLALAPLRLIEEPNGDWRLLFWMHAGVLCLLTLTFAGWSGGWPWLRHFSFPVFFLFLAVPWPSAPEQALVQWLMHRVAAISSELLGLLGLPATPQGNLIRIRDQVVGVNEACSGIRSLQTVLMGALMLGELSRYSWPRRAALLAGGIAVAMAANIFRSSLLVWIAAHSGVAALHHYHDAAGIAVLLIVFAGLLSINKLLDTRRPPAPAYASATRGRLLPARAALVALAWLGLIEVGTSAWYILHERGRAVMPTWTVKPPENAPDFRPTPVDDITRALLRYDTAQSARWRRPGLSCSMFFFRWEPGRASATLASMHQPTACLPSTGMTQIGQTEKRRVSTPIGVDLPVEQSEFSYNGQRLHVFYVVWQDRTGYELPGDVTQADRLKVAWQGQRNLGQQTLEMVIAGPPNPSEAADAFTRELAAVIRRKG